MTEVGRVINDTEVIVVDANGVQNNNYRIVYERGYLVVKKS